MKIKVLHIRLSKELFAADEEAVNKFLTSVIVKQTESQFVSTPQNFWSLVVWYEDKEQASQKTVLPPSISQSAQELTELTEHELKQLQHLKRWREEYAQRNQLQALAVLGNMEMVKIVRAHISNEAQLSQIQGISISKIQTIAKEILEALGVLE